MPQKRVALGIPGATRFSASFRVSPERLEKTLDAKYLVRTNGLYYLNLARDWRIGATAHRIISLAEANGALVRRKTS